MLACHCQNSFKGRADIARLVNIEHRLSHGSDGKGQLAPYQNMHGDFFLYFALLFFAQGGVLPKE